MLYKDLSYWEQETLLKPADFLILGAGLTGLHTSIQLKNKYPSKRIIILERGPFSIGASTRNAGFACFGSISEILDDLRQSSEEEVYNLILDRYNGLQKTRELIGDAAFDFQHKGSHEIFNSGNEKDLKAALEYLPHANTQLYKYLGIKNVFKKTDFLDFGFTNQVAAIANNYEGQLHSGKLYAALWAMALQLGVGIYGGSDAIEMEITETGIKVYTKTGMVFSAEQLIITTNAFASDLLPELEIVATRGQVLLTEKMPDLKMKGIFHYDKGYYYWRDLDKRILLGGARNTDFEGEQTHDLNLNEKVQKALEHFLFETIIPYHPDVKIEMRWSGIMAMGPQKNPIIKRINDRVVVAARMGGMGVALSSVVAEKAVKLLEK
jgi:glycine/D-amino acid oxidase-like deaminating enzyme